jgi:DNA-binding response OmpR family regulator
MRVLLVDDEIRLTEDEAHALREGPSLSVDHAESGQPGLDLAEDLCDDLILLDLIPPKLDGLTVLCGRGDNTVGDNTGSESA